MAAGCQRPGQQGIECLCGGAVSGSNAEDALAALMVLHVWGLDAALDKHLVHLASMLGLCAQPDQHAAAQGVMRGSAPCTVSAWPCMCQL